ncbi:MAG TPA: acetate--CoA ligase family protein, partial [Methylocystis sp.]
MTAWQDALFAPRRVAVVGASATPGKAGHLFLSNLVNPEAGFAGEIIAIHPSATEVLGCPSYPSLALAPQPIDLAIVVTPPAAVPGVIEDCGRACVAVAVVITGGFAETGPRGAELQRDIVQAAAASGVRIIGPNCFGVINTVSGLNASLSIGLPAKGGVSLITQSGAYGMAAYTRSIDEGAGFAKIIALGNKADVDEADLLEFLAKDPDTKVVAILLESISDGRKLFETAAATRKPIVALKTGRGPDAQRAAASHTAALSSDAAVALAALRQAGVHLVEDGLALLDVAAALAQQPLLRGRRIGVITNSGGTGVELTDLLESKGLAVPVLSPTLQAAIAKALPPHGSAINPIDVTTEWSRFAAMYEASIDALMYSDEIDAVVPVLLQRSALMPQVADTIIAATERARGGGSTKPVHVCWVAPRTADANREKLRAAGIPCHSWPAATAANLAATSAHTPRLRPTLPAADLIPVPASIDAGCWVGSAEVFFLLQQAGFPVARWAIAADAGQAADVADEIHYPVVLKAERSGLVHKSDAGAVRANIADRAAVAQAFTEFCDKFGPGPALIQQQARPGVELVVGARRDKSFGPIIMAGLGGVWIEALNDVALRLAPIGDDEARSMFEELKGRKLLTGLRGRPPIELPRLAQLIARLSRWFCAAPWLEELDLNPIIAEGDAFIIVDARMRAVP